MDFDARFDARPLTPPLSRTQLEDGLTEYLRGRKVYALAPLEGGYRNTNLWVEVDGAEPVVVRVVRREARALRAELDVMAMARRVAPVPEVLHVAWDAVGEGVHLVVSELAPGRLLSVMEDRLDDIALRSIAEDVGRLAVAIHAIEFERPGYLGPGGTICESFHRLGLTSIGLLSSLLESAAVRGRLDTEQADVIRAWVERDGDLLKALDPSSRLVHSDFNHKNLLVVEQNGRWGISAVLDWEFALSGSPLMDLGNFLRFEDEQPAVWRSVVPEAYVAAGGQLGERWRERARLLDAVALLQFLGDPRDRPRTIETSRSLLLASATR